MKTASAASNTGCRYRSVSLRDFDITNTSAETFQVTVPDREPMILCGGRSPGVIATDSRTVRLDYKTDDEGLSRGWSLSYSSSGNGLGRSVRSSRAVIWFWFGSQRVTLYFSKQMFCFAVSGCEEPEPLLNGGVTRLSGSPNQQGSVIQYHCNEPFYSFPWGENGKTTH